MSHSLCSLWCHFLPWISLTQYQCFHRAVELEIDFDISNSFHSFQSLSAFEGLFLNSDELMEPKMVLNISSQYKVSGRRAESISSEGYLLCSGTNVVISSSCGLGAVRGMSSGLETYRILFFCRSVPAEIHLAYVLCLVEMSSRRSAFPAVLELICKILPIK